LKAVDYVFRSKACKNDRSPSTLVLPPLAATFIVLTPSRVSGKDNSVETNRIDAPPGGQQPNRSPPQRGNPDGDDAALKFQQRGTPAKTVAETVATTATTTVTSPSAGSSGDVTLTSPKRGDAPEELVPTNGAFFFALGCGSALIVTLVAVTSALAYKRTNKTLSTRSKSKESLQ